MQDALIKHLISTLKCGACGEPYSAQDLHILGHRDEMWFVHVRCPGCGSRGMVAAVVKAVAAHQEVSDLSPQEEEQFQGPVSADDVLEMHNFLKDFYGEPKELFPKT